MKQYIKSIVIGLIFVFLPHIFAQLGADEEWACGTTDSKFDKWVTQNIVNDRFPPNEYLSGFVAPLIAEPDLYYAQRVCTPIGIAYWSGACLEHDACMDAKGSTGISSEGCHDNLLNGWKSACRKAYSLTADESKVYFQSEGQSWGNTQTMIDIATKEACYNLCSSMAEKSKELMLLGISRTFPAVEQPQTTSTTGETQNQTTFIEALDINIDNEILNNYRTSPFIFVKTYDEISSEYGPSSQSELFNNYLISTYLGGGYVMEVENVSKVSFYTALDDCEMNFYVDGVLMETKNNSTWNLVTVDLLPVRHTLKWEFFGLRGYLDNIKFTPFNLQERLVKSPLQLDGANIISVNSENIYLPKNLLNIDYYSHWETNLYSENYYKNTNYYGEFTKEFNGKTYWLMKDHKDYPDAPFFQSGFGENINDNFYLPLYLEVNEPGNYILEIKTYLQSDFPDRVHSHYFNLKIIPSLNPIYGLLLN